MDVFLSVICPVYNEEKYILNCIQSIALQDYPKESLEVLFVDGMSTDATRSIIEEQAVIYPYIRLIDNPMKIVPYAMNKGIEHTKGDVIIRIDAHTSYEPNYFSALVRSLYELNGDDVGSVCKTEVLNKTPKTLAIREVLSNKFGVGNSVFRTGVSEVQQVDTVPFGCWRREVFDKYGKYDVRLVRNQDIELSKRIIRGGGKIFIIPDTFCTYYARESFKALAQNNYGNGKWIILTVFYTGEVNSLSPRHFVPLVFILSLLIPLFVAIFLHPVFLVAGASLLAYCIVIGTVSYKLAKEKKLSFLRLMQSFIILHTSYGWGALMGLLSLPFLKR